MIMIGNNIQNSNVCMYVCMLVSGCTVDRSAGVLHRHDARCRKPGAYSPRTEAVHNSQGHATTLAVRHWTNVMQFSFSAKLQLYDGASLACS